MQRRRQDEFDGTTDEATDYVRGPGRVRPQRSAGAVIEIYADGAIDRRCHECGAAPLDFCHEHGIERKLPHPTR